jgi:hypothetical protein
VQLRRRRRRLPPALVLGMYRPLGLSSTQPGSALHVRPQHSRIHTPQSFLQNNKPTLFFTTFPFNERAHSSYICLYILWGDTLRGGIIQCKGIFPTRESHHSQDYSPPPSPTSPRTKMWATLPGRKSPPPQPQNRLYRRWGGGIQYCMVSIAYYLWWQYEVKT